MVRVWEDAEAEVVLRVIAFNTAAGVSQVELQVRLADEITQLTL